jgi:hypothetical protein
MQSQYKNILKILLAAITFFLVGCVKKASDFYPDSDSEGLAIFSNTGNNIASCYMDGKEWRTRDRIYGTFFGRPNYEIDVFRRSGAGLQDTLYFNWDGYFGTTNSFTGSTWLNLEVYVPKSFSYKSFGGLTGKRIAIDTTNGFFTMSREVLSPNNNRGKGNIYFHTASLDSLGPFSYAGQINGLFEADFGNIKITKGRFDHKLDVGQVSW